MPILPYLHQRWVCEWVEAGFNHRPQNTPAARLPRYMGRNPEFPGTYSALYQRKRLGFNWLELVFVSTGGYATGVGIERYYSHQQEWVAIPPWAHGWELDDAYWLGWPAELPP